MLIVMLVFGSDFDVGADVDFGFEIDVEFDVDVDGVGFCFEYKY